MHAQSVDEGFLSRSLLCIAVFRENEDEYELAERRVEALEI